MWNIEEFEELASTNSTAKERLLADLAHHGDVVQTYHQTSGRGRFPDRVWLDEPHSSLLMSIILTEFRFDRQEFIQYFAAIAVYNALASYFPMGGAERVQIKWPNDLLIDRRKVGGILAEAVWKGEYLRGIVVGIGLNIRSQPNAERVPSSIALSEAVGLTSVKDVRDRILSELERLIEEYDQLPRHVARMALLTELRTRLDWMRSVPSLNLSTAGNVEHGVRFVDVDDTGALVVMSANGEERTLRAGSLSLP